MRTTSRTLTAMTTRKNAYQKHIYLPLWMREAIQASAAKRRAWNAQTVIEAAIEEWLERDGFTAPPRPPPPR